MKITEVIKELEKYKKKFGDIEVLICDMECGFTPVEHFNYEEKELRDPSDCYVDVLKEWLLLS